ncbi:MAG TPA: DUF2336 domain-containing protein [Pseudolabrys sp.]|jgi:uncharacterized protein (DUF2336 family)|nr:DUF2336 domain-containing protein [Pseudolabrys sp.]
MVMVEQSVIAELEGAFASGSTEKQADILRRITDLFLAGAGTYAADQTDLFDGVLYRLTERIETKARAELARRLAPVDEAPPATVRRLAYDESIEVAAPILRQSRLAESDLLAVARLNGQGRLLAISKRASISEKVSDVLVTRGDRDVVLSISRNSGARFSDAGYGKLVSRSIGDDELATCIGLRKDIPREHFYALISKASEMVFERLVAANPAAVADVKEIVAGIAVEEIAVAPSAEAQRDHREAEAKFDSLRRSGRPVDAIVHELAATGRFEETVAALATLGGVPHALVGAIMQDRMGDHDFLLLLAKAAGLSWPTTKQICLLRRGEMGLPQQTAEAARRSFDRLQPLTAQRVVRFYNERHSAAAAFQRLARHIREQDDAPATRRFSRAAQER